MSKVAIIGRPNVGKSTLFNRLVGKKLALVDDQPGVTRDRREGEATLFDADFTLIDTAGLDDAAEETLAGRMRQQTEVAVADADVILFVIDSRVGVTPMDSHFAGLVRRADKPIIVVANKAEGRAGESGALEAHGLGLGTPVAISAEHNEGMIDLYDALAAVLPKAAPELPEEEAAPLVLGEDEDGTELDPTKPLRIAVVGRPNAGKSTLLNAWLGEDRLLTGPEPGITRDSIGIAFKWRDRDLKVFDTAGLRKRSRIEDKVEKLAAADAIRAVQFAEVVIVLLDATIPFEKQDLTIASLAEREGRAVVIGVNKWDLIEARGSKLSELRESAERLLPQIKGVPVVPVSGRTGFGLDKLLEASFKIAETMEPPPVDLAHQPLAVDGARRQPAAGGQRPAHQDPLHDAAEGPAADLRAVRQPAERPAEILPALPRKPDARGAGPARHPHPAGDAPGRQPLRQEQEPLSPAMTAVKTGRHSGRRRPSPRMHPTLPESPCLST